MKNRKAKRNKNKQSLLSSIQTLPPLQGFSSGETDFYFCQFLSDFLRYFFSNFPLFYLYNNFAVYFLSNSLLLKSCFSTKFNFFYLLTSILILFLNSATAFFAFSKSFVRVVKVGLYLFFFLFYFYFYLLSILRTRVMSSDVICHCHKLSHNMTQCHIIT